MERLGRASREIVTRRRDQKSCYLPLAIFQAGKRLNQASQESRAGTHYDGFLAVTFHELESIIRPFER
jgi:hypothetical protein